MNANARLALTPGEVLRAGLLPYSRAGLYAAIARGAIPAVRAGRKLLIPRAWLEREFGPLPEGSGQSETRATGA